MKLYSFSHTKLPVKLKLIQAEQKYKKFEVTFRVPKCDLAIEQN